MSEAPHRETPADLAGYKETRTPSEAVRRPDAFPYADQFASYQRRLDAPHGSIPTDPKEAAGSRSFEAWNELVRTMKLVGDNSVVLSIVNGWVNTAIRYDDAKGKIFDAAHGTDPNYIQTGRETLLRSEGNCADVVALKKETLQAIGYENHDMRMVAGVRFGSKGETVGHMVLDVAKSGVNIILDNPALNLKDHHIGDNTPKTTLMQMSQVHAPTFSADDFVYGIGRAKETGRAFTPVASFSEGSGVHYYETPSAPTTPRLPTPAGTPARAAEMQTAIDKIGQDELASLFVGAARLNPDYANSSTNEPSLTYSTPQKQNRPYHASLKSPHDVKTPPIASPLIKPPPLLPRVGP